MFKVTPLGRNVETNKSICSGVMFGFLNMPLSFKVDSDFISGSLVVNFTVSRDKNFKEMEFRIGAAEGNIQQIYFYNPPKSGSIAIKSPVAIGAIGHDLLAFMFYADLLPDNDCYRMTYEFYHGKIPALAEAEE